MKIALTGNPNSGKTTMYNLLTGRKEKVGNWAGVTVEKSEFCIRDVYCEAGGEKLIAVDLPGTYSMSPFTSEEVVTSEYVKNENPDVIINILDSTNLSRGLFFTTQLLELGIPVVVALNKWDLCEKMEIDIDEKELEEKLKCPVVKTISAKVSNNGLKSMISEAVSCKGKEQKSPYNENKLEINNRGEAELADRRRFEFVKEIVAKVVKEREPGKETGDKCRKKHIDRIDRILTVPWFGIPIFAVIMFFVFFISQTTLGTWVSELLTVEIEKLQGGISKGMEGTSPFLQSLLLDGIIGGVGAVLGFLPLVMIMYFLIALLEDCGYMARATVVLDPLFKRVGLSGKSVIPMIIGTGCAIPGIMACRTIHNERERRATAMLVPIVGVAAWQLAAASITGFIAKENVVGTLAVCYGLGAFIDTDELTLVGNGNVVATTMGITKVAALSFLMFNLFTPPCFAAIGAMNSELKSKKWLLGGITLQFCMGYIVSLFVYQIGRIIETGNIGNSAIVFVIMLLVGMAAWIIIKEKRAGKRCIGCSAPGCGGHCSKCK